MRRLICMETSAGPALPPFAVPGRVAFVTSVGGTGDLGSWPDAATAAIDRFVNDGRWVRLDGVAVAESKADLTDGVLFAPINVTEVGDYLGNWIVWTGTNTSRFATGFDCTGWTVGNSFTRGTTGPANDLRLWTWMSQTDCNVGGVRLYCFSDTSLFIFTDGFESGNTSAWTAQQPPP